MTLPDNKAFKMRNFPVLQNPDAICHLTCKGFETIDFIQHNQKIFVSVYSVAKNHIVLGDYETGFVDGDSIMVKSNDSGRFYQFLNVDSLVDCLDKLKAKYTSPNLNAKIFIFRDLIYLTFKTSQNNPELEVTKKMLSDMTKFKPDTIRDILKIADNYSKAFNVDYFRCFVLAFDLVVNK